MNKKVGLLKNSLDFPWYNGVCFFEVECGWSCMQYIPSKENFEKVLSEKGTFREIIFKPCYFQISLVKATTIKLQKPKFAFDNIYPYIEFSFDLVLSFLLLVEIRFPKKMSFQCNFYISA